MFQIKKNVDSKKLKVVHEDKTLPVCWKGIEPFKSINDVQMFFKPLALKFSKVKNAVIEMSPEAYLVINVSIILFICSCDFDKVQSLKSLSFCLAIWECMPGNFGWW